MATKMATIFGDVTGLIHLYIYLILQKDQRLSPEGKGKIYSNYCNISKTLRRGFIKPPLTCITVGI